MAADKENQPGQVAPGVTEEMVRRYLAKEGVCCLFCGSKDIEGGSYDYESPQLGQKVTCLKCGRSWIDVYVLARVEVVE